MVVQHSGLKIKCVLYFCLAFVSGTLVVYMAFISSKSEAIVLNLHDDFEKMPMGNKDQQHKFARESDPMDSVHLSWKAEVARRKLSNDARVFWSFMAAQLGLHYGYHIEKLTNLTEVTSYLQEYLQLLAKDLQSYKAAVLSEPAISNRRMPMLLSDLNASFTSLFKRSFAAVEDLEKEKNTQASQFSNKTKMDVRAKYFEVLSNFHHLVNLKDDPSSWRYKRSIGLGDVIWQNIQYLQNPENCATARKLVCGPFMQWMNCGFGCTLHHVSLCLISAYLSNRTMILNGKDWKYSKSGWTSTFLPVNTKCDMKDIKSDSPDHGSISFSGNRTLLNPVFGGMRDAIYPSISYRETIKLDFNTDHQIQSMLFNDSTETVIMRIPIRSKPRPYIFPMAMPQEVWDTVVRFNSHPPSWWLGQFKAWASRLNDDMQKKVKVHKEELGIQSPIVGMHIRRTDKKAESSYYMLNEYMNYAEEWIAEYEYINRVKLRKPKLYIATDEPAIIKEAKNSYPRYEFLYDPNISLSAIPKARYSENSLRGLLKDIHSLLQCDYIVCTFSSTFCRLVYEVMQTQHGEVTHRIQSLDRFYFVSGDHAQTGLAIEAHKKRRSNELGFAKGDFLGLNENHWDGFSVGKQPRTKRTGLYPTYKIQHIFQTFNLSSKIKSKEGLKNMN